jgi:hypothetical protein
VWVTFRGWPRRVQIVVALLVLIVIVSVSTSGPKKTGVTSQTTPPTTEQAAAATTAPVTPSIPKAEKDARSYIVAHGGDAYRVEANIATVQLSVGILQKQATQSNLNQVAVSSQTAHDNLDNIRNNFTGSYGSDALGNAQLEVFGAANDLKNAMGALVAYTGNPNPATLAHFTTQYQMAVGEWNDGVRIIWRLAHRGKPPVL